MIFGVPFVSRRRKHIAGSDALGFSESNEPPNQSHPLVSAQRIARTKRILAGKRAFGVIGLAGAVFSAVGVLVRYSFLQAIDLQLTKEFQKKRKPALEPVMVGFTISGSPMVLPVLGGSVALLLWRSALPRAAGLVVYSLVAIPITIAMKTFWDRERPDAKIVNVAVATSGTSFPSGHAMGATSFYGALASLAWIHLDRRTRRLPITLSLASLVVCIGASRIYLGAHWFSDVVGGSAVGAVILMPLARWYLVGIPAEVSTQAALKGEAALTPTFGRPPLALPHRTVLG